MSSQSGDISGAVAAADTLRDVAVLEIVSPPETVLVCSTYSLLATITNHGDVVEYDLMVWVTFGGDIYGDTETVSTLAPGDTDTVVFTPVGVPCAPDSIWYEMVVFACLSEDSNQADNGLVDSVFAYDPSVDRHDLGIYEIKGPCGPVWQGDTLHVECVVMNCGTFIEENFPVEAVITASDTIDTVYLDTTWVLGIFPGCSIDVGFQDFVVPFGLDTAFLACFTVSAYHDIRPENNRKCCDLWSQTGIELKRESGLSIVFGLGEVRPNPSSGGAKISYSLPSVASVRLSVCDPAGRVVNTLVDGVEAPGTRSVSWDGTDGSGTRVPSGVYFFRLIADRLKDAKKVVLVS